MIKEVKRCIRLFSYMLITNSYDAHILHIITEVYNYLVITNGSLIIIMEPVSKYILTASKCLLTKWPALYFYLRDTGGGR